MTAHPRKLLTALGDTFWLKPGASVIVGILAAGQMGTRLPRNFTRDRGNQLTLGTLLGTFSYTLMALRSAISA